MQYQDRHLKSKGWLAASLQVLQRDDEADSGCPLNPLMIDQLGHHHAKQSLYQPQDHSQRASQNSFLLHLSSDPPIPSMNA